MRFVGTRMSGCEAGGAHAIQGLVHIDVLDRVKRIAEVAGVADDSRGCCKDSPNRGSGAEALCLRGATCDLVIPGTQ